MEGKWASCPGLLDPAAQGLQAGVELVRHAGNNGKSGILKRGGGGLKEIEPVRSRKAGDVIIRLFVFRSAVHEPGKGVVENSQALEGVFQFLFVGEKSMGVYDCR